MSALSTELLVCVSRDYMSGNMGTHRYSGAEGVWLQAVAKPNRSLMHNIAAQAWMPLTDSPCVGMCRALWPLHLFSPCKCCRVVSAA